MFAEKKLPEQAANVDSDYMMIKYLLAVTLQPCAIASSTLVDWPIWQHSSYLEHGPPIRESGFTGNS